MMMGNIITLYSKFSQLSAMKKKFGTQCTSAFKIHVHNSLMCYFTIHRPVLYLYIKTLVIIRCIDLMDYILCRLPEVKSNGQK